MAGASLPEDPKIAPLTSSLEWAIMLRELRCGSPRQQCDVLVRIRAYGELAIEPACAALADPEPEVRIAAAETLAEIGDRRAIAPLSEAIRSLYVGRSIRRTRLWRATRHPVDAGQAFFASGCLFEIWWLFPFLVVGFWLADHLGSKKLTKESRQQREFVSAVVTALGEVARRCPSPEARAIIPELRALAASKPGRYTIGSETLEAALRTADFIESATAAQQSLPIPLGTPHGSSLPRVAAWQPDAVSLPLPGNELPSDRLSQEENEQASE